MIRLYNLFDRHWTIWDQIINVINSLWWIYLHNITVKRFICRGKSITRRPTTLTFTDEFLNFSECIYFLVVKNTRLVVIILMYSNSSELFFLSNKFKGDIATAVLKKRPSRSLRKMFCSVELCTVFSNKKLIQVCVKGELPLWPTSVYIYQFTCSFGAVYIDRTKRAFSRLISEHYLAWPSKRDSKSINSSILEHMVDSGHMVLQELSLMIIYKV